MTLEYTELNQTKIIQQTRNKTKDGKITYHLQDIEDVYMIEMKKKVVGLDNGKYIGISSMYNFRCDPDLGIGKVACRQIPCACLTCLGFLNIPWGKKL